MTIREKKFIPLPKSKKSPRPNLSYGQPLLRLSGAELNVRIHYYENGFLSGYECGAAGESCVIARVQVRASPNFAGHQETAYGPPALGQGDGDESYIASARARYYTGVKIVFKEGTFGKFGFVTVQAILVFVALLFVYCKITEIGIKLFACNALGDTSKRYYRASTEAFNIDRDGQQVTPSKILLAAAAFRILCQMGGEKGCLTINGKKYLTKHALYALFGQVYGGVMSQQMIAVGVFAGVVVWEVVLL